MAPSNDGVGDGASSSNENVASSLRSEAVGGEIEVEVGLAADRAASRCFINPGFVSSENDRNNRNFKKFSWESISGYREYASSTLPNQARSFSRCLSRISLPENERGTTLLLPRNRGRSSARFVNRAVVEDLSGRPRSSQNYRASSAAAFAARNFFIRRAPVRLKSKKRNRRARPNPDSRSCPALHPSGQTGNSDVVAGNGDAEPRPASALASSSMPNAEGRRHHVGNGGSGRCPPRTELPPIMGMTSNVGGHQHEEITQLDNGIRQRSDALPDILHSHLPPPYSTLPPNDRTNHPGARRLPPPAHPPPPPPHLAPQPVCHGGQCPPSPPPITSRNRSARNANGRGNSFNPFLGNAGRLRGVSAGSVRASAAISAAHHHPHGPPHHHPPLHGGGVSSEGEEPKHCCGVMVTQSISIRWFIVMIAFVGLCCAIVGTVLGALKATGREHLTVSLLMIGVGIVLITVSGIAWRLTSHDAPSCRAMLGLQPSSSGATANPDLNRRFLPRVPPYGRPPHPYAAMLYPEFQYRPPPPSYQASMQEYRLRLLLLDRQQGTTVPPNALSPVSPPPTYRSHASSTLHSRPPLSFVDRDYSRPPSYRSRASSVAILRSGAPHASSDTLDSRLTRNDTIGDLPDSSSGCPTNRNANTPGTNTPSSAFMPGTPPSHSHSRDPSLTLSYLSHESLMFNDSAHSALPLSSADIARSVTDRSTLDRSTLERPPLLTSPSGESRTSVTAGLSDDSPVAVAMPLVITPPDCWTSPSSTNATSELNLGSCSPEVIVRTGNKHPDINTVTIVQTTDSSQVRNQDTVIVAVTGTQQVIPNPNRSSGLRNILPSVQMQLGPDGYKASKNEVQILAQV